MMADKDDPLVEFLNTLFKIFYSLAFAKLNHATPLTRFGFSLEMIH
jgi:hypothetical protein